MKIKDYTDYPKNGEMYGGNAGSKYGIDIDNEPWMLKLPKSTSGFKDVGISYTTNATSEYIGSHVYELIGIPVHETMLGTNDGKLVVLCRDFTGKDGANGQIVDFKSMKNDYSRELDEYLATTDNSQENGYPLDTIRQMFKLNPYMKTVKGLEERFWDMFIVDALIGNNDRNIENWGALRSRQEHTVKPCSVYDNGNSFRNKASDEQLRKTLSNPSALKNSAYNSQTCCFTDKNGKNINPYKYIQNCNVKECNDAVKRIIPKIDMNKIKTMIDEIPEETETGIPVISKTQKEYDYKIMETRYNDILLPAYEKIMEKESDLGKQIAAIPDETTLHLFVSEHTMKIMDEK